MNCPKCNTDNPSDSKHCKECGTQLISADDAQPSFTKTLETPKEELTTGSTFAGRYQIIEELGRGGMGKVYRVLDKKLNEEVALKLIKPDITADKKTIERFKNELKLARKIRQKNVGSMYELLEEKGIHFITMEYVSGQDLKGLIRQTGQLTVGKAISIAKQICEGLAEAHRMGVVHRDLKPNNIMIDRGGNARIMDFGIARAVKGKSITGAGVMIGTPQYMSPEQVEGKDVDQRSDIYSLGIILYEMLTDRVPFEGDTPLTVGVKQKTETPKDPKDFNERISDDLNQMILRCLEKESENRYQSADEVRSELERFEQGLPTTDRVIPKKKPLTSKEFTVTFGVKKVFIPTLVVITVAVIAFLVWNPWSKRETILVSGDKPSLAVMYFENNTGDESLDHYRKAISDLLITDLVQSKYLKVLSGARLLNILSQLNQLEAKSYSSEVLREVAAKGGIEHILLGSYTKAGDTFRINVTLQEASTAELIGSEGVEGRGEESIFSMVDELTRKIKEKFELSVEEIASDIDEEVGKITTSSPEAYRFYIQGRKYHTSGEYRQSIAHMEKAVAIDPEFAMAYRSLAVSYYNLGLMPMYREYIQKALELSDRLSERERYLIQGGSEKTFDKKIETYNKLLELYPEDSIGNQNLGLMYYFLEDWDKAIERYEVCRKIKTEFYGSYEQLAAAYRAKGFSDKATEVLEFYLHNVSDDDNIHRALALEFLYQGKYDLALEEMDKAFTLDPTDFLNFASKGNIYHYREDLIKAEKEYLKLLEEKEPQARFFGREGLANLYLLQGRFEKSKDQREKGIEFARKIGVKWAESEWHSSLAYWYLKSGNHEEASKKSDEAWKSAVEAERPDLQRLALHYKGIAYLGMKSRAEAQRTADELRATIEKGPLRKAIRDYDHLMGMIELKRENFSKSIEHFKKALSLLSPQYSQFYIKINQHAFFVEPLALAYYKAGDVERAREEYERIISLTTGRIHYGDIYAKSFYMLGKIYEQQGDTAKAIEHYEKFLSLWKDADPGVAEVEDAKNRLAELRGQ